MECSFCGSELIDIVFVGEVHKVDHTFGPFDLARCRHCGSLCTLNAPTPARLASFYRDYHLHRPNWYNAASANGALDAQYSFYARYTANALASSNDEWVDIGSGHGEVANLLSDYRPSSRGAAVDIGERSAGLSSKVEYYPRDLNAEGWATQLGRQFDMVFSVAVWEHVRSPLSFATECLSLVRSGGTLLLIAPDYGSVAATLLGRRWPYFEPGEHLSIPSRLGAVDCLKLAAGSLGHSDARVRSRSLWVGYSASYLFSVLGMRAIANMIPPKIAVPLPTGILVATVDLA
ncbi:Methyltransferase type 11 [Rhodopseudomonas palustris BisB5]|uniref:Methyltransferase type 11 n=1 Tax=Rhodopseudomonas palustris (strain BisB5) TaxID=316057 RepID=Q13D45_RHOPS|nr:Methyltransferase type 11 [Rhodopseudomonas palustris BisB5]